MFNQNKRGFMPIVYKKLVFVVILALLVSFFAHPPLAKAAVITSFTDNMSRLMTGQLADHEIKFVSPTGIASGQNVVLTFGTGFTLGTFATSSVDFATGNTGNCTSASFTEQTLAATPGGATWGIATSSASSIQLTSGTGTSAAGNCVRFRIGANAVVGAQGASLITNGSAGNLNATVAVSGNFGDSGTLFEPIITNDQVVITATVAPSISFSISSNSIGFGTLTSGNVRYATGDTLGTSTLTSAHNLIVGTNASTGYNVYVLGSTLTSGVNTITAIGGTAASSTQGSAQFGLNLSASGGSGAAVSPYNYSTSYAYAASSSTQSQIATASGPSANTTYNVTYIANIPAQQQAGAYSTTLTYTAVGSF